MDDLSEKISDWSCQPVAFNMSRGELILAICGILALALLLHLNWDWVFGAH